MICEAEGTCGTTKMGKGPVYDEKRAELDRQQKILETTTAQHQAQITENTHKIATLETALKAKVAQVQSAQLAADSILAQIQAMHEMAAEKPTIAWTSTLISAIFICIDVMPILGKLLAKRTVYDAYKQHQAIAKIRDQDALTCNLEHEIADHLHRRNKVREKSTDLFEKALANADAGTPILSS
jgi:hypothetical protein